LLKSISQQSQPSYTFVLQKMKEQCFETELQYTQETIFTPENDFWIDAKPRKSMGII
jgi:hypothetical protein